MQHGRHDASGTIGRCSDDPAARGVFLIDRHGVQVDEIQNGELVFQCLLGPGAQRAVQLSGAALDAQATGQMTLGAAAAGHAGLHGLPDRVQPVVKLLIGAPGVLVAAHHLGNRQAGAYRDGQQLVAAGERVGHHRGVHHQLGLIGRTIGLLLRHHKAATHREITPLLDGRAIGGKSPQTYPI